MKELYYLYGGYRLIVRYCGNDHAQVSMYDLSELHFPLLWSSSMTYQAANGAIKLFKAIGYFDMPV